MLRFDPAVMADLDKFNKTRNDIVHSGGDQSKNKEYLETVLTVALTVFASERRTATMLDGAEGAIDGACAVAMTRGSTEGRNAGVAVAPTITAAVAPAATTAPVSTEWLACSVTCRHESPSRRSDSQPRNANTALRPAVRPCSTYSLTYSSATFSRRWTAPTLMPRRRAICRFDSPAK